jgi:undecaprenyl-diphosphatase
MSRDSRIRILAACFLLLAAPAFHGQEMPRFEAGSPLPASQDAQSSLGLPQAIALGLVEGLTEYLPISSTGHLMVAARLLGLDRTPRDKSASDAYAICIQGGAILAVLLVSFGRIRRMAMGVFGADRDGLRLLGNLAVSFIPAAAVGLLFEERLKGGLFGAWPVAVAWFVGGLFILVLARRTRGREGFALEGLALRSALVIGLAQTLALWPGVSRSLATIAAGVLVGLSASAAVEYSFLLGLLTLGAATLYEGVRKGAEIVATFGWVSPLVGFAVAALSAFIAVRWMVSYLRTRGLAVFGWYRLAASLVLAILLFAGVM